jgi:hypothetical protein
MAEKQPGDNGLQRNSGKGRGERKGLARAYLLTDLLPNHLGCHQLTLTSAPANYNFARFGNLSSGGPQKKMTFLGASTGYWENFNSGFICRNSASVGPPPNCFQ